MCASTPFSGAEAAAETAWDDLDPSERAALAFLHLEAAAGGPTAFKFLARAASGSEDTPGALQSL
jgi:hypothetical protein